MIDGVKLVDERRLIRHGKIVPGLKARGWFDPIPALIFFDGNRVRCSLPLEQTVEVGYRIANKDFNRMFESAQS